VLEAHAFGVPVMGADLGGISERIRNGVDGWLLPFDDSAAWATAIQEIVLDRAKLAQIASNIEPCRTMGDVAAEMATLYRDILARAS
jgi:glycosyltransferase involved in cell wall biosynthesis